MGKMCPHTEMSSLIINIISTFFSFSVCAVNVLADRPRAPLALTPMISVVIGLAAAIVIGALAIIVALRVPCGRRRKRLKRKELSQATTTDDDSPGPSDKSIASREIDGNESDEKNPDIIPDTIDSDDQVSKPPRFHVVKYLDFRFRPEQTSRTGLLHSHEP